MMTTPRAEQSRKWLLSGLIVLYEMKICTFLKSVCEEAAANPLFSHNHHRDTRFFVAVSSSTATKGIFNMISRKHRSRELRLKTRKLKPSWCFKNSDPKKKTIFHRVFAANCNVVKSVSVTQFHSCQIPCVLR